MLKNIAELLGLAQANISVSDGKVKADVAPKKKEGMKTEARADVAPEETPKTKHKFAQDKSSATKSSRPDPSKRKPAATHEEEEKDAKRKKVEMKAATVATDAPEEVDMWAAMAATDAPEEEQVESEKESQGEEEQP